MAPTSPLTAYFDNSALGHLYRHEAGATEKTEAKLRTAVGDGRLIIPFSAITAEEALAAFKTAPEEALGKSRLYMELATHDRRLREPSDLVRSALAAYAAGYPEPRLVYEPFPRGERAVAEALFTARNLQDVEDVTREAREQIEAFHGRMLAAYSDAQKGMQQHRDGGGKIPEFLDLWTHLSLHYTEGLTKGPLRDACRRRGIDGLLRSRWILAYIGGAIGVIHAQAVNGRKPDFGDSRDLLHLVGAAAAGGIFVTNDGRLGKLTGQIPDLNLETVTLADLATRF